MWPVTTILACSHGSGVAVRPSSSKSREFIGRRQCDRGHESRVAAACVGRGRANDTFSSTTSAAPSSSSKYVWLGIVCAVLWWARRPARWPWRWCSNSQCHRAVTSRRPAAASTLCSTWFSDDFLCFLTLFSSAINTTPRVVTDDLL